jgi:hypothetical protein
MVQIHDERDRSLHATLRATNRQPRAIIAVPISRIALRLSQDHDAEQHGQHKADADERIGRAQRDFREHIQPDHAPSP